MLLKSDKCKSRLHRVFRASMILGLLVFVAAVYLIITGHYEGHLARQGVEAVLNRFAIGGLVSVAIFWSADVLSKPFLCPSVKQ